MIVFSVLLVGWLLGTAFAGRHASRLAIFSPATLVGWFGLVYLLIPIAAVELGAETKWTAYVNESALYSAAHGPFVIFALSAILAAGLARRSSKRAVPPSDQHTRTWYPYILLAVCTSAFLFLAVSGSLSVNFSETASAFGGVENKFLLSFVDLAVPALALLVCKGSRGVSKKVVLAGLAVILMYVLLGSRYRIATVVLLILWYMVYRGHSLFNAKVLVVGAVSLVGLMFFSLGRTYRQGFNLEAAAEADSANLFTSLINESNIQMAMGAVTSFVPAYRPYDPWSPIVVAISSLVPRALWQQKPSPEYLLAIPAALRDPALDTSGAALPIYGEWYMMGGYIAVFLIGVVVIYLLQRQYLAALQTGEAALAACITCFCAYAYTRGYLAQNLLAYLFIVAPALPAYSKFRRKRPGAVVRPAHY